MAIFTRPAMKPEEYEINHLSKIIKSYFPWIKFITRRRKRICNIIGLPDDLFNYRCNLKMQTFVFDIIRIVFQQKRHWQYIKIKSTFCIAAQENRYGIICT